MFRTSWYRSYFHLTISSASVGGISHELLAPKKTSPTMHCMGVRRGVASKMMNAAATLNNPLKLSEYICGGHLSLFTEYPV